MSGVPRSKVWINEQEEFVERLQNDDIAKKVLTKEYIEWFMKNYGSWTIKDQYENKRYIGSKFANKAYSFCIVSRLKELIRENKEKKQIDEKASLLVRELLDSGYNANYVYQQLHEVFFHQKVDSLDSLDIFFDKFDFSNRKYDVYIGYSHDISPSFPLLRN